MALDLVAAPDLVARHGNGAGAESPAAWCMVRGLPASSYSAAQPGLPGSPDRAGPAPRPNVAPGSPAPPSAGSERAEQTPRVRRDASKGTRIEAQGTATIAGPRRASRNERAVAPGAQREPGGSGFGSSGLAPPAAAQCGTACLARGASAARRRVQQNLVVSRACQPLRRWRCLAGDRRTGRCCIHRSRGRAQAQRLQRPSARHQQTRELLAAHTWATRSWRLRSDYHRAVVPVMAQHDGVANRRAR